MAGAATATGGAAAIGGSGGGSGGVDATGGAGGAGQPSGGADGGAVAGTGSTTASGGSAGAAAGSGAGGAAGAGGFRDSFEDGTLEPWAPGPEGGGAVVTDELAANGTAMSLMVPGDVDYYAGPNIAIEPIAASYVSWWMRYTGATPGNNGVAHFALSADLDAQDKLLQIWAASDGFIIDGPRFSTVLDESDPPAPDTWYHLELSIDWTTRAVILSVDGTEILDNELTGTGESIVRIDLFTVEEATSYFDEIVLLP